MPRRRSTGLLLIAAAALPLFFCCGCHDDSGITPGYETAHPSAAVEVPAMCPWRDPQGDLRRFFPGADGYRQETLILSSLRLEILKRLGPGVPLESNALYVYRATQGKSDRGTILVRRAGGEYGAIEVVVALDPARRVVGVHLQRHREPPPVADVITSPQWLGAFRGKSASDAFHVGGDLPAVPPAAQKSAEAVARAVRSLLIEFEVAETQAHR
jgi:hypothetical protein